MGVRGSGRERPTLEKVALRAGVSRATVSRVVNGAPTVHPRIRDTVLRVVQELGYVPNPAARSLVTQRTDSYALVVPERASRVFSDDQFFPGVIRGVSQELEEADKQLVLMLASSAVSHDRIERYAKGGHVDGVMFASLHGADPMPAALARLGIPVVANGRPLGRQTVPYVDVDHAGGVALAVHHLLELGRGRIATIAGPQDMIAGIERLTGYRSALRGSRRRSIVAVGDFTRESGSLAMRQLLEDDPQLDAVFVASDPRPPSSSPPNWYYETQPDPARNSPPWSTSRGARRQPHPVRSAGLLYLYGPSFTGQGLTGAWGTPQARGFRTTT